MFKKTMLYGYSPFRPLGYAFGVAAIGVGIMLVATYSGVIESPQGTVRILGSIATAVGALIPLDTLFLEPQSTTASHSSGWQEVVYNLTWGWYWFETAAGWVLAAITVAGLTNPFVGLKPKTRAKSRSLTQPRLPREACAPRA